MPANVVARIAETLGMTPHEIASEMLGMQVEEPRISLEVAARIWADALKADIETNIPLKGD